MEGTIDIHEAMIEDLPRLELLFRRANDVGYALEAVVEEKCFGRGFSGDPVCLTASIDGALAGFAVVCGAYLRLIGVDPRHRRRGVGSRLLQAACSEAETHGHKRLVVAAEPGNYFVPGVPENLPSMIRWLERRGFTTSGHAINLAADLRHCDLSPVSPPPPLSIKAATHDRADEILDFIRTEFSPAWAFEVSSAFDDPHPPLFVAERDGQIIGFSAHDVNNRGLGFYGPAGVSSPQRGSGIGRLLLLASMRDMSQRGYERIIIPWVSSVHFYRKVTGAEPEQAFVRMEKKLD